MARPTKKEAARMLGWSMNYLAKCDQIAAADLYALQDFLERVQSALPSDAAVQRDRERRRSQADQGVPLCRGCHTHHDSGERCPE